LAKLAVGLAGVDQDWARSTNVVSTVGGFAISAIDAARHEIVVNAYALSIGSGIPTALIIAHDRRVDVRLVAEVVRRVMCAIYRGAVAICVGI
jgi:hypothetical protein